MNSIIDTLIHENCTLDEILKMFTYCIDQKREKSLLELLDKHLFKIICTHLDNKSLHNICLVSKNINNKICNYDSFWIKRIISNTAVTQEEIKTNPRIFYWKLSNKRCSYIFQRGAKKGTKCKNKCLNTKKKGSRDYCVNCINKISVQRKLGRTGPIYFTRNKDFTTYLNKNVV